MDYRLLVLAALLMVSALMFGCINQNNGVPDYLAAVDVKVFDGEKYLVDKTVTVGHGTNGLDIMEEATEIEYTMQAYGAFVTSIAGREAAQDEYWALYVNREYADKGISLYEAENGMEIEWKLENINEAFK